MSTPDDTTTDGRTTRFMAVAAVIGDLGSAFYDEERQRDVWNEASAIGLQFALWLGLVAATAMIWIGRQSALPYAVTLLAVIGAASWISLLYARGLGVDAAHSGSALRLRAVPYVVLLTLFLVGALRAAPTGDFQRGLVVGMLTGSTVGIVVLIWSGLRARRRERSHA